MRTTPDKFYDSGVQDWAKDVTKGVSETMMQGGNPLTRSYRGVKAVIRERTKSPWRDKGSVIKQSAPFAALSTTLRFIGKQRAAEWVDRFTATQYKVKTPQQKQAKSVGDGGVGTAVSGMTKQINVITGSLIRIESQIGILQAAVIDVGSDVTDIKSLLMPKDITVKGKPLTDEWGREDRSAVGKMRFAQYNPLAPAGMEFLKVSEKQLGKGFYTRGHVTSKPLEEGFVEDAIKQASIATAALVMKMQKKDKEKAELKLKNQYTDPKERKAFEANPLLLLLDTMNARFDQLEELLKKMGSGGEQDSTLEDIAEAAAGAALGGMIPGLAKEMIKALPFLGIAAIPGLALALATYWAETADMNNPGYNPFAWTAKLGKDFADWANEKSGRNDKWKAKAEENRAAGRMPGGVASTGYKSQEESNAALLKAYREATTEEARNAYATTLRNLGIAIPNDNAPSAPKPSHPTTLKVKPESNVIRNPNNGIVMNLPPEAMAFLDALSQPESEGKYDTIVGKGKYGGPSKLKSFSHHPAQAGVGLDSNGAWVPINSPKRKLVSTAAGRYQITKSTWDELVDRYGFKDFSPQNQDQAAWYLAQERYRQETGMDLYDALRAGDKAQFKSISKGLSKTWTSLSGGAEAQARGSAEATQSRYESALPARISQGGNYDQYKDTALASTTPRLMPSGAGMDTDSREIAQAFSPSATVAALQPIIVKQPMPQIKAPPMLPLLTLSGMSNDSTILNMADRNHALS